MSLSLSPSSRLRWFIGLEFGLELEELDPLEDRLVGEDEPKTKGASSLVPWI